MSARRFLRALALAIVLAATPACTTLRIADPVAAAQTTDQKAYALVSAYALILEQATILLADPATPAALKRALARSEAAATPAVELVKIAAAATREASGAADAAQRDASLARAIQAAAAPIAALSQLVNR